MFTYPFPRPAVTVDAVVFRERQADIEVLLIKRKYPPFDGFWAAPGGFIEMDETPEVAVLRELREETGIERVVLHQYHTYGAVDRDPRHRTISIAFAGLLNDNSQSVRGSDDASDASWFPVNNLPRLAFDHSEVINDALDFGRMRGWF